MREINPQEMADVTGSGIFSNVLGQIGKVVGGLVDAGTSLGGFKTDATTPATMMGKGIGSIVEFNIFTGIYQIGSSVVGMVGFGIDAISQIANKLKK
ncbi:hypothetical protein NB069_14715 [Leclercia adecarboxylata]|uniref:hypothetical protein n=1 Tax=Leclercia adecarboxylata TaxID=83655 RepID=UPI00202AB562|nr:hypothetical protein [Leclercia adecarboxylata]URN97928.1 hypothetical protein NB069_14715 [Leclercia adecarboxylata]